MAIDSKHKEYEDLVPIWEKCRAVYGGEDDVRKMGSKLMPRLSEETDEHYKNRLKRSPFVNFTSRTIDGIVGIIFRKPVKLVYPDSMQMIIDDVDLEGNSFQKITKNIVQESLNYNRYGVLVDYPKVDFENATVADIERQNIRPFLKTYSVFCIHDWRYDLINGKRELSFVKLYEETEELIDEFTVKKGCQYRVLDLMEGVYRQRVFVKIAEGKFEQIEPDYFPVKRGKKLSYIPFKFAPNDELEKPIFLDLVNVNISHYILNSDYENGCHTAGLPTPVISGYSADENETIAVGETSICLPDPSAKAYFLEFTGQGMGALEKNLEKKESSMAFLGLKVLMNDSRANESGYALEIRKSSENSIACELVYDCDVVMNWALMELSDWYGYDGDVSIQINDDFISSMLDAQTIGALINAVTSGNMSQEMLFYNLKRGELYPDDATFEDEQTRISNGFDFNLNNAG